VRALVEHRELVSGLVAAAASAAAWTRWPWPAANPVLQLVAVHQPVLYRTWHVTYAILLFTTPYLVSSVVLSLAYIFVVTRYPAITRMPLPQYPDPGSSEPLFLVVGECHHPTKPGPSAAPGWLTIPDRGLFTGIAIIGAVGSGKTSGCMYPFANQLFAYRRTDPDRRVGGLVLEVKGDFCHQ
jgi:hypothetical protein